MADFTQLTAAEEAALRRLKVVARQRRMQQIGSAIDSSRIRVSQVLRAYFKPGHPSRYRWATRLCEREAAALVSLSRRPAALRWLALLESKLIVKLERDR